MKTHFDLQQLATHDQLQLRMRIAELELKLFRTEMALKQKAHECQQLHDGLKVKELQVKHQSSVGACTSFRAELEKEYEIKLSDIAYDEYTGEIFR